MLDFGLDFVGVFGGFYGIDGPRGHLPGLLVDHPLGLHDRLQHLLNILINLLHDLPQDLDVFDLELPDFLLEKRELVLVFDEGLEIFHCHCSLILHKNKPKNQKNLLTSSYPMP